MRSKRRRTVKLLSCDVASPHAELKALTTTPFMVEIVMQILRQLQRLRGTDAVMKQQLALLLDSDDAVELVWGQLSAWRRKPRGGESKCIVPSSICSVPDDDLEDVRNALEVRKEARDGASTKAMESLKVLSQDIAKAFGEIKNGAKVAVPQSLLTVHARRCARAESSSESGKNRGSSQFCRGTTSSNSCARVSERGA